MSISRNERFTGVEDEFRVVDSSGRGVLIDELINRSRRFFFNEGTHVPILEYGERQESTNWRIWTWYGGTLYHDYDVTGSLVETTTPLVRLSDGVGALVDKVIVQRTQLIELCEECRITGVSTHVNLSLDYSFAGDDLCRFEVPVPSGEFVSVTTQKLGADIALLTTHTVYPVIAYLLFNRYPRKGALYRPRKNRRMELCLPFVTEPEQMRAGFAFWFATVEYFTNLIKSDLARYLDWQKHYKLPDYYTVLLPKLPAVIRDVSYQRPSYILGFQVSTAHEANIMENGSRAIVKTTRGEMSVLELGKVYIEHLESEIRRFGGNEALSLIRDYLNLRKSATVDFYGMPRFLNLSADFTETTTGRSVKSYLNNHRVVEPATIHLKFLEAPCRTIHLYNRRMPLRVIRNLGRKLDWNHITLEVVEENEYDVRQYLLEVPLDEVDDYISAEDYCGTPYVFLSVIRRWVKAVTVISNPRSLFAYGTLMSPERNKKHFGALVTAVQAAHAYGTAYDFGDFPVMVDDPDGGIVPGIVMNISNFEETVSKFDVYEGINDPNPVFVRVIREIMIEGAHRVPAWLYVGNRNNRYVANKLAKARRLNGLWNKHGLRDRHGAASP